MNEINNKYIYWVVFHVLSCGCEPHGHKCLISEGGCGRCVEHCTCTLLPRLTDLTSKKSKKRKN